TACADWKTTKACIAASKISLKRWCPSAALRRKREQLAILRRPRRCWSIGRNHGHFFQSHLSSSLPIRLNSDPPGGVSPSDALFRLIPANLVKEAPAKLELPRAVTTEGLSFDGRNQGSRATCRYSPGRRSDSRFARVR